MFQAFDEVMRRLDDLQSDDDGESYTARMTARVKATLEADATEDSDLDAALRARFKADAQKVGRIR